MQKNLYEEAIKKINSMKENKVIENQVREINEILFLNGFNQDEDFTIASRYKSEESIEEKLARKSYKYLDQLTDLAGIKIVFKDLDTTMEACKMLRDNLEIIKEDDYFKDTRNTGYKSIHFNLEDKNGNILELQVKDKLNDIKQQYCHSNIYKNTLFREDYKSELNDHMNCFIEKFYNRDMKDKLNLLYKINKEDEAYFNTELKESSKGFKNIKNNTEKDENYKKKINLNDLDLLAKNIRQSQAVIDFESSKENRFIGKDEK